MSIRSLQTRINLSIQPLASSSRHFSSSSSSNLESIATSNSTQTSDKPFTWRDYTGPEFPVREPLKRSHGIRVASLILSAHHPYRLELYSHFAWQSAQSLGIPAARPAPLKKSKELITVIKSPFVFKKAQENFERRHHHREIVAYDADKKTIDMWLRYVRNNGIGGVGMRATVHEWVDVGFGQADVDGAQPQTQTAQADQAVAAEADRILKEMEASEPGKAEQKEQKGKTQSAAKKSAGAGKAK